jgi:hypothetical protein
MPPLSLTPIPEDDTYPEVLNANLVAIEAFCNSLAAQILAASGDGADLILDSFDRPGIVGAHSYYLDIENYGGGGQITIGRRPAPNVGMGESDVSVAWGTFGGQKTRVTQQGDVVLSAVPILNGLPKTIYVGIPSSGTAQLFEDNLTPNVLYIYSLCWNGFSFSEFRRLGHYLPGYSLLQVLTKHAQIVQVSDWETQWTSDLIGEMSLPLHGASAANEIGANAAYEVIGGFVDIPRSGPGRFYCPSSEQNKLFLKLTCAGVKWNLDDIEINVQGTPDRIYFAIDTGVVGDARFVTDVEDFRLERVSIGAHVVSARGYTLGLFVRPILGVPIPKDPAKVDQV